MLDHDEETLKEQEEVEMDTETKQMKTQAQATKVDTVIVPIELWYHHLIQELGLKLPSSWSQLSGLVQQLGPGFYACGKEMLVKVFGNGWEKRKIMLKEGY